MVVVVVGERGGGGCYTLCDRCDKAKVPSLKIRQIYSMTQRAQPGF